MCALPGVVVATAVVGIEPGITESVGAGEVTVVDGSVVVVVGTVGPGTTDNVGPDDGVASVVVVPVGTVVVESIRPGTMDTVRPERVVVVTSVVGAVVGPDSIESVGAGDVDVSATVVVVVGT